MRLRAALLVCLSLVLTPLLASVAKAQEVPKVPQQSNVVADPSVEEVEDTICGSYPDSYGCTPNRGSRDLSDVAGEAADASLTASDALYGNQSGEAPLSSDSRESRGIGEDAASDSLAASQALEGGDGEPIGERSGVKNVTNDTAANSPSASQALNSDQGYDEYADDTQSSGDTESASPADRPAPRAEDYGRITSSSEPPAVSGGAVSGGARGSNTPGRSSTDGSSEAAYSSSSVTGEDEEVGAVAEGTAETESEVGASESEPRISTLPDTGGVSPLVLGLGAGVAFAGLLLARRS
jgi:hypothetical protein